MAKVTRKKSQFQKEAIVKVFNKDLQRYTDVIIPSSLTVGLPNSEFQLPLKLNGSLEFKTTAAAPNNTDLAMYVVGSTLYFNGSEVGSGGGGAPTTAQYVTLATDSTLTHERVLTAGSNITITDGGAGSTVTIAASAGSGGWTDDGTDVRLTTATDSVGIGTTSPTYKLHVSTDTATEAEVGVTQYNNTTADDGSNLRLQRARGTEGSPAVVQDGDHLGSVFWYGHDGTDFEIAASIRCDVDGSPAGDSTDMPGRLTFCTTPDGSDVDAERMRINNTGSVGINTDTPGMSKLHVYNNATIGAIGSLNLANAGLRIQDSSYSMFIDGNTFNIDGPGHIDVMTNDYFKIATNDTTRMTILGGGNVGVGVANPSTVFHVEGDAVTIGNGATGPGEIRLLEDTDLGSYYAGFKAGNLTENTAYEMPTAFPAANRVLQSDSSGVLTWVVDATHDDVGWVGYSSGEIITTGSVGIGTNASPAELLEVKDSDGTATTLQINNTGAGDPQLSWALSGVKKFTAGVDDDDGDKFKIGTTAVDTNTVLTIDMSAGGYLGLGTTTPAEALEVETAYATTTLQLSNTAVTGDPQVAFALSGTKKFTMGVDDSDSDKFKIGTTACSTDTMLTIDANGNVGIGTTAPEAYLDIKNVVDDGETNRTMLRLHNYRTDDADVNDFAPTSIDFVVENVTGGAKSATSRISSVQAPIGTDHTIPAGEKSSALIFSTMNNETLAEAVRINNLGYVGIGTAAPSGSLDVKGDGSTSQIFLLSGSGAEASPDESSYADVNFFVSGAMGSKDSSTKGTAIFGGDVVISGTLHGGTPLKIAGGMEVTGTMELKPSAGGVAIVRNPHGPVKLCASSALKLGSNIGTIDLLDLGDGAAGQILLQGAGALAARSVELNSPGTLFFTGTVGGAYFKGPMDVDGTIVPGTDNTYDLGSSTHRYANIYTGDLHLQNDRGHWQIIEERDYLCVVNRLTGKRYKMALEPMDDDE